MIVRPGVPVVGLLTALLLGSCDRDHHWMTGMIEKEFGVHTGVGDTISITAVNNGRYVSVEGVWTIEGDDRIAAPINITRITCTQDDDPYCETTNAMVHTIGGRPTLMMNGDIYRVTAWTGAEITAVHDGQCRTQTLRISEAENSVTELTTERSGCADPLSGPLDRPRLARLISGAELDAKRQRGERL